MGEHPVRCPDFVVAGAARAGSTAVVEALRSHPDVFVCQPKEPHFLAYGGSGARFTGPGDEETINRVAVVDEAEYTRLFADADPAALTGEGSVSTLYRHEEAFPRLLERNPRARLVIMLRDPVERAFSSYQYLRNRGYERESRFLDAVAQEPQRRESGWHHLWHYTAMSRYAEPVRHAMKAFGIEQVGVFWYDDLQRDPDDTFGRIFAFVGADPALRQRSDAQPVNASGSPRLAWVQLAMRRAREITPMRRAVKAAVPFSVRERIRNANLRPNQLGGTERMALRPEFDYDLDELERCLGATVPMAWRR